VSASTLHYLDIVHHTLSRAKSVNVDGGQKRSPLTLRLRVTREGLSSERDGAAPSS